MLFARVLTFATLAMAVPTASTTTSLTVADMAALDKRQTGTITATGPISSAVLAAANIINTAIAANIGNITAAVSNITQATDQTVAQLNASIQNIQNAIINATGTLFSGIINAQGGLLGIILSLTSTEIANISAAFNVLATALQKLGPIVTLDTSLAQAAIQTAVQNEIAALQGLLAPFLGPLQAIGTALQAIKLSIDTSPLVQAINAIQTFAQTLFGQI